MNEGGQLGLLREAAGMLSWAECSITADGTVNTVATPNIIPIMSCAISV